MITIAIIRFETSTINLINAQCNTLMQRAFDERQDLEQTHSANQDKMTNANSVLGSRNTELTYKKEQVKAAQGEHAQCESELEGVKKAKKKYDGEVRNFLKVYGEARSTVEDAKSR